MTLTAGDRDYLLQFSSIFRSFDDAEQYLNDCWQRNEIVFQWIDELNSQHPIHKVLELGSNPYYLTLLLRRHFQFDLELANFFGDAARNGHCTETIQAGGKNHDFSYMHFNVESDPFPYADRSFDLVIFCEIIEHLLLSADHPVAEIRRILKPGGFMILSTPNALRLANLIQLIRGKNIYADYSANGAYGRHNREYSLDELRELLKRHRFTVERTRVSNIYPHSLKSRVVQKLRPETWYEHLFVLARKPDSG